MLAAEFSVLSNLLKTKEQPGKARSKYSERKAIGVGTMSGSLNERQRAWVL
jgi:hypothetical protein